MEVCGQWTRGSQSEGAGDPELVALVSPLGPVFCCMSQASVAARETGIRLGLRSKENFTVVGIPQRPRCFINILNVYIGIQAFLAKILFTPNSYALFCYRYALKFDKTWPDINWYLYIISIHVNLLVLPVTFNKRCPSRGLGDSRKMRRVSVQMVHFISDILLGL